MHPRSSFRFCVLCLTVLLLGPSLAAEAQKPNPNYDKALSDSLGADEYGMKTYVLVMLKTGQVTVEKKVNDSLFAGHMKNIGALVSAGKLIVAGPLKKNEKNYRGIFILNVPTIEEAKALLQTDPAVKAGLLDADLFNWYGSAALPMYLPHSEKMGKTSF
jgi:uncharacterized protein